MRMRTPSAVFASSLGLLLVAGATRIAAQETQVGTLHGNAAAGKQDYRRYCVGCHGPAGDGNGENAQWIERLHAYGLLRPSFRPPLVRDRLYAQSVSLHRHRLSGYLQ